MSRDRANVFEHVQQQDIRSLVRWIYSRTAMTKVFLRACPSLQLRARSKRVFSLQRHLADLAGGLTAFSYQSILAELSKSVPATIRS